MAKKKPRVTEEVSHEPAPPPLLPSREEIDTLPHWARVAFCARVARRVLPLVAHCWETVVTVKYLHNRSHLRGTRKCVRETERAAAQGAVVSSQALYDAREAAYVAGSQSEYAATLAGREKGAPQYAAGLAANAAGAAATAALMLTYPHWQCDYWHPAWHAAEAAALVGCGAAVETAIRADFEIVRRLATEQAWSAETPVAPKVFGPLWPNGAPAGWPSDR